jgi:hypothetical protein
VRLERIAQARGQQPSDVVAERLRDASRSVRLSGGELVRDRSAVAGASASTAAKRPAPSRASLRPEAAALMS